MHFIEGIQQEWNLVKSHLSQNSITIFDDLQLKGVQKFRDWFKTFSMKLCNSKVSNCL